MGLCCCHDCCCKAVVVDDVEMDNHYHYAWVASVLLVQTEILDQEVQEILAVTDDVAEDDEEPVDQGVEAAHHLVEED